MMLHYKNVRRMSFEKCTKVMMKCLICFTSIPISVIQIRQKAKKLLNFIRCQEGKLLAVKVTIDQQAEAEAEETVILM
jgi:hypothetical protein